EARNLMMFQGHMIFDLRPPIGVDKGTAFQQLVERHQLDAAVYLGDDTTDLDAMRMARDLRERGLCYAVGLGVVSDYMPPVLPDHADAMLDGISGVEAFLEWLLIAVSASSI
ncbi:MAG: trehalose-phosphatase, partial [Chloroflexi bacterium]